MKNEIQWLEGLKNSLNGVTSATPAEVEKWNEKLKKFNGYEEFLALQEEMVKAGNVTFASNINKKLVVLNRFAILIKISGENVSQKCLDHAMNSSNPENVLRYYIYDDACDRIRNRMVTVDMLKKSLKIVAHDWSTYSKFAKSIHDDLLAKLVEIEKRPDDDKHKLTLIERLNTNIKTFRNLLS